jgi:hypothetical protein
MGSMQCNAEFRYQLSITSFPAYNIGTDRTENIPVLHCTPWKHACLLLLSHYLARLLYTRLFRVLCQATGLYTTILLYKNILLKFSH